jgi:hypothetical protein
MISKPPLSRDDLQALIRRLIEAFNALPPEEQRKQRAAHLLGLRQPVDRQPAHYPRNGRESGGGRMNPLLKGLGPTPESGPLPHDPFVLCQVAILRWRDRAQGISPADRACANELDALIQELADMWKGKR